MSPGGAVLLAGILFMAIVGAAVAYRDDHPKRKKAETNKVQFMRITVNSKQMGGTPCIRGLRIPVATVVDMMADDMTEADILKAYPDLVHEDIREALQCAAEALRECYGN